MVTFVFTFCVLIAFGSPWYDLRSWLGVKNQLSICLCMSASFLNLFCFPLDDPFRESWVRLQQLQGQRYLFLQVFRAVVIHRTLTWNTEFVAFVLDWSFFCVRIHTGVGHTDSESANFWLVEKLNLFLCCWRSSNSGHWCHSIFQSDAVPMNWAPPSCKKLVL